MSADPPRLLHRRSELGYTASASQALNAEPEAIWEAEQRAYSVTARAKFLEDRSEEIARRDSKAWADRLRKAEQRASAKQIDVRRWEVEIRRGIVGMEEAVEAASQFRDAWQGT